MEQKKPIFNDTVTRIYMHYKGAKPTTHYRLDLSPLMHFFLMDCVRGLFKAFDTFELTEKQQKTKNKWKQALRDFDSRFWVPFKTGKNRQEMENFIIDKLDEYQKFIEHHLYIARIAWEESCNEMSREQQEQFSALWLSNRLAADAQGVHVSLYKTPSGQEKFDHEIDTVLKATQDLCLSIYPQNDMTEKKYRRIIAAADAVVNNTRAWLMKDSEKDEALVKEWLEAKKSAQQPTADSLEQLKNRFKTC